MNLVADTLSFNFLLSGWLIYLLFAGWALWTAPWFKVENDRHAQNVLLGASVIVLLVWLFSASLDNGLTFHFLLMAVMTLMFGPQFALMGMSLALFGVTFQSGIGWEGFGLNAAVMGIIPIMITWGMFRLGLRFLEMNFFVYTLYNGFLSAAIGATLSLAVSAWILWVGDVHTLAILKQTFIPYIPMLSAPEGFLNGLLIAALVLFRPDWIATFRH
ncbi:MULTISPECIES: energy-coupling factor ABC transporter permease [Thiomicrorhabdus]|uniref:Energy-coupling factor ABC transporter permease n=1 Tax=Thiomicrorhabdus heinhorstiae TaxID=2748010 RepID=A0ABS0BTL1_9GAMM|nr:MULTISPECIES: energy-coupling factor ABC transporter permease [Thiomicrorhabdus]MBF6057139.1 energy-coupling factor ABC transporter permease [Thiomicrorhabdus heinhorstiae]